ncbi:MAG: hypothetical protein V1776_03980 [Candidatus Diapherotrites archaeon]
MNEEVVHNTIQKMRDAGLSESVISSTLTDLGLSPAQTQAYLAGRSSPVPSPVSNSVSQGQNDSSRGEEYSPSLSDADHEVISSRTSDKVVQRLDERNSFREEENSLKDNITHLALEQHGVQLRDTHQAVIELHDKLDGTNLDTMSSRLSSLVTRMEQLQQSQSDTRALAGALQLLLQKVLETNQQILFELKKEKK